MPDDKPLKRATKTFGSLLFSSKRGSEIKQGQAPQPMSTSQSTEQAERVESAGAQGASSSGSGGRALSRTLSMRRSPGSTSQPSQSSDAAPSTVGDVAHEQGGSVSAPQLTNTPAALRGKQLNRTMSMRRGPASPKPKINEPRALADLSEGAEAEGLSELGFGSPGSPGSPGTLTALYFQHL